MARRQSLIAWVYGEQALGEPLTAISHNNGLQFSLSDDAAQPVITTGGHRVAIVVKMGGPADAEQASGAGAEGVGLLRNEFLIPLAALMADAFAPEVDFFSVGTNDLTQYTLAIHRMHPSLVKLSDGLHPAVLRLIARTVEAAHNAGKWVGVCGELGADPQAVPILIGIGVDELSVGVPAVPTVKAQVRSLALSDAKHLAERALACATAAGVHALRS